MQQNTKVMTDSFTSPRFFTIIDSRYLVYTIPMDPDALAAEIQEREIVEDLILQNKTLEALIQGLTDDIEVLKKDNNMKRNPADIVRFTMQLNIMKDKKTRNLAAINEIIKDKTYKN